MAEECPFCAIATGEAVPDGGLLFNGAGVIAFRPLKPFAPGHTLIVPREHVESFVDAGDRVTAGVMSVARTLAREGKGPDGFNLLTSAGAAATQTVMHWHVHMLPRQSGDELGGWPWRDPRDGAPFVRRSSGTQIHISSSPSPSPGLSRAHVEEAFIEGRRQGRAGY